MAEGYEWSRLWGGVLSPHWGGVWGGICAHPHKKIPFETECFGVFSAVLTAHLNCKQPGAALVVGGFQQVIRRCEDIAVDGEFLHHFCVLYFHPAACSAAHFRPEF